MRRLLVAAIALLLALAMSPVGTAMAGGPPATFTTVNTFVDGTGHCKNGPADATTVVNCNIYDGKEFVWLNGGPDNAALADGTYFFAVLVPGGQHDPNEGAAKNLSDTAALPAGTPGGGDSPSRTSAHMTSRTTCSVSCRTTTRPARVAYTSSPFARSRRRARRRSIRAIASTTHSRSRKRTRQSPSKPS